VQGDPTEGALLVAARKGGLDDRTLAARWRRVAELPFSSERKLMSTVHEDAERDSQRMLFTKGAPEVLLPRCSHELVGGEPVALVPARREALARENEALADQALRTLATACRNLDAVATTDAGGGNVRVDDSAEQSLVLLGLVGMIDPPRAEARDAVMRAREAGIRPILITGDHPRTAAVIAPSWGSATTAARRRERRSRSFPTRRSRRPWRRCRYTRASIQRTSCASSTRCNGMAKSWR
jgi:Ca2+-transporting ATPase